MDSKDKSITAVFFLFNIHHPPISKRYHTLSKANDGISLAIAKDTLILC